MTSVDDPVAERALERELGAALERIVSARMPAPSVSASIAIVLDGSNVVLASTDETARQLGRLQFLDPVAAGPTTLRTGEPSSAAPSDGSDAAVCERDAGVTGRLTVPILNPAADASLPAVLSVWSLAAGIDHESVRQSAGDIAGLVGRIVAVAAAMRAAQQLERELRDVDGQVVHLAQGIVMEHRRCSIADAQRYLLDRAARQGGDLEAVAREVVAEQRRGTGPKVARRGASSAG